MNAFIQTANLARELSVFFLALVIGLTAIILLRHFWTWNRGRDRGDGVRKLQAEPVLRVGGLALYAVFLFGVFVSRYFDSTGEAAIIGPSFLILGTTMFLLGFVDDLFGLPALLRMLVQIAVGIAAYLCEMRIDLVSNPLGGGSIEMGGFGLILTVIWFVSIPNLINLVDGMDGLAGGIALFLCLTLATLGGIAGNGELLILNIALVGGIVAFLAFNLPPAKIYMGDGGAYLLGFVIAGVSLLTSNKGSVFGSLLVVIVALGFPILDTLFAILRRGLSGLPVMRPDARHLHHRLLTLGFSKRSILFILYGLFAGLSLLGLSIFLTSGYTLPVVGMIVTIGLIQGLRFLGLPHNLSEARKVMRDIVAARKDVRYAHVMSQVLEHDLERFSEPEDFWAAVGEFLARLGITPVVAPLDTAARREGRCLVIVEIDSSTIWVLGCPRPEGTRRQWDRVVRCFYPVIVGGKARWDEGLPESLGFMTVSPGSNIKKLEDELNADVVIVSEFEENSSENEEFTR